MTLAARVKTRLEQNQCKAYSLYSGYGLTYNDTQITFPIGSIELEKRNDTGRVIHARYRYADNSVLVYKFVHETPRLTLQ